MRFFINFARNNFVMKNYSIEIFMPAANGACDISSLAPLLDRPEITKVWLLGAYPSRAVLPGKVAALQVESLQSTAAFRMVAKAATADFVLFVGKPGVCIDTDMLLKMCDAMPGGAPMAYSHYRKVIDGRCADAPTIDCQQGSLRNDFDFGAATLYRLKALKEYLAMSLEDCSYAGFYQLRLAMMRLGELFHFCSYVYTEDETDTRKSGEKQFDYVNPAQRDVQIEMERVCTHHLKSVKS